MNKADCRGEAPVEEDRREEEAAEALEETLVETLEEVAAGEGRRKNYLVHFASVAVRDKELSHGVYFFRSKAVFLLCSTAV